MQLKKAEWREPWMADEERQIMKKQWRPCAESSKMPTFRNRSLIPETRDLLDGANIKEDKTTASCSKYSA